MNKKRRGAEKRLKESSVLSLHPRFGIFPCYTQTLCSQKPHKTPSPPWCCSRGLSATSRAVPRVWALNGDRAPAVLLLRG